MATAERVDKWHVDAEALVTTGKQSGLAKECDRLSAWLQKHQGEIVPQAQQVKLMQLADLHFKHGANKYDGNLGNLLSTLLSMPEGKLVSAKSKAKLLKMLDGISDKKKTGPVFGESTNVTKPKLFAILDVEAAKREVVVDVDGEVVEKVKCPLSQFEKLLPLFEAGEISLSVTLCPISGHVTALFDSDTRAEL